ncbi:hypothetical protein D3C79_34630 [compost metagenome]
MAGTIYLSDKEMQTILHLWHQASDQLERSSDEEFAREASGWAADVQSIEQKFKTASTMSRARSIANKMSKNEDKQ